MPPTNHHPRHYRFPGMSVSTASPKVTLEFPSFSSDFRRFLSTKHAPPMNSFSKRFTLSLCVNFETNVFHRKQPARNRQKPIGIDRVPRADDVDALLTYTLVCGWRMRKVVKSKTSTDSFIGCQNKTSDLTFKWAMVVSCAFEHMWPTERYTLWQTK